MRRILAAAIALSLSLSPAWAAIPAPHAVSQIGPERQPVGAGQIALFTSAEWSATLPAVTRAIVIVHGLNRNADTYLATIEQARQASGLDPATVLLAAPQLLAEADSAPDGVLRWHWNGWSDGEDALAPAPISSFAALDAVLAHLADHARYPALTEIVVAGFSAGGQMVQRYAAVGHAAGALEAAGIHVRYIVGSPSSYLYFSPDRPVPAPSCPGVNTWRFGLAAGVPSYAGPSPDPAALGRAYAAQNITYLLGGADTDPNQRVLDRSCGAEAQGATRLARGLAFTDYLRARYPTETQPRWIIPGVGHNARRVFTSVCGVAALFGTPGCPPP